MNTLRAELQELLGSVKCSRKPVLRRSREEEHLYTTDLPAAADDENIRLFLMLAGKNGWKADPGNGWIELDKPVTTLKQSGAPAAFGAEAACCLSLLKRHPPENCKKQQQAADDTAREIRKLIKAAECGPAEYETACRRLHAALAARLRMKEALPDIHRSFFEKETADTDRTGGNEIC